MFEAVWKDRMNVGNKEIGQEGVAVPYILRYRSCPSLIVKTEVYEGWYLVLPKV